MLVRAARKAKTHDVGPKLASYLLKGVDYYFPGDVTASNYGKFASLLKICKGQKFPKPELQKVNSKHLALYLQN